MKMRFIIPLLIACVLAAAESASFRRAAEIQNDLLRAELQTLLKQRDLVSQQDGDEDEPGFIQDEEEDENGFIQDEEEDENGFMQDEEEDENGFMQDEEEDKNGFMQDEEEDENGLESIAQLQGFFSRVRRGVSKAKKWIRLGKKLFNIVKKMRRCIPGPITRQSLLRSAPCIIRNFPTSLPRIQTTDDSDEDGFLRRLEREVAKQQDEEEDENGFMQDEEEDENGLKRKESIAQLQGFFSRVRRGVSKAKKWIRLGKKLFNIVKKMRRCIPGPITRQSLLRSAPCIIRNFPTSLPRIQATDDSDEDGFLRRLEREVAKQQDEEEEENGFMQDEEEDENGFMQDEEEDENGFIQDEEEEENGLMQDEEEDENGFIQDEEEDENGFMQDEEEDENGFMQDEEEDENGLERKENIAQLQGFFNRIRNVYKKVRRGVRRGVSKAKKWIRLGKKLVSIVKKMRSCIPGPITRQSLLRNAPCIIRNFPTSLPRIQSTDDSDEDGFLRRLEREVAKQQDEEEDENGFIQDEEEDENGFMQDEEEDENGLKQKENIAQLQGFFSRIRNVYKKVRRGVSKAKKWIRLGKKLVSIVKKMRSCIPGPITRQSLLRNAPCIIRNFPTSLPRIQSTDDSDEDGFLRRLEREVATVENASSNLAHAQFFGKIKRFFHRIKCKIVKKFTGKVMRGCHKFFLRPKLRRILAPAGR